ncbi:MAG: response regulator [Cyclobacteriaceae bacterium]
MPEMNGIEFIQQAREVKPNLKFIVMSAYAKDTSITALMKEGIVIHYLEKSYSNNLIAKILREYSD